MPEGFTFGAKPQHDKRSQGFVTRNATTHFLCNLSEQPETELQQSLAKYLREDRLAEALNIALHRKREGEMLESIGCLEAPLPELVEHLLANRDLAIASEALAESIQALTGETLENVVASSAFQAALAQLGNTLFLGAILKETGVSQMQNKRAFLALKILAGWKTQRFQPPSSCSLGDLLDDALLLLPSPSANSGTQLFPSSVNFHAGPGTYGRIPTKLDGSAMTAGFRSRSSS